MHRFFASAARGTESVLEGELQQLGAERVHAVPGGVQFEGSITTAYRACLWSRTATRVLLELAVGGASDSDELYESARGVDWSQHFEPTTSFAVTAIASQSAAVSHAGFALRRIKDAVVDQFRDRVGDRPPVDVGGAQFKIHAHLFGERVRLSIDLAGESLHRRGYREAGGRRDQVGAPLKENVAAWALLRAGADQTLKEGGCLLDPMCGGGTLVLEAAMIAADIAPGRHRLRYGFHGWLGHQPDIWRDIFAEAEERANTGLARLQDLPPLLGFDQNPAAIASAEAAAAELGLGATAAFEVRGIGDWHAVAPQGSTGIVICNPPWGVRMGDEGQLAEVYADLGARVLENCPGYRFGVLTGTPRLGRALGLHAQRRHDVDNGGVDCQLLVMNADPSATFAARTQQRRAVEITSAGEALANRLKKNRRKLAAWIKRENIECFRLYDADIPEFAIAVDIYGAEHAQIQEYAPPKSIDPELARRRLKEAVAVVVRELGLERRQVAVKRRQKHKRGSQYEALEGRRGRIEVGEGRARFLVEADGYIDTGLYLDHRETRRRVAEASVGKRLLNLFAYTGTATVQAALAGAASSVSVDLSRTYTEWMADNFRLNGLRPERHRIDRSDVRAWLTSARRPEFDVVFVDPPTFSNSKSAEFDFDVQRDHVPMLRAIRRCLKPGGEIIFSTHLRSFAIERDGLGDFDITAWSPATVPPDFKRRPRIHQCFHLELRA